MKDAKNAKGNSTSYTVLMLKMKVETAVTRQKMMMVISSLSKYIRYSLAWNREKNKYSQMMIMQQRVMISSVILPITRLVIGKKPITNNIINAIFV